MTAHVFLRQLVYLFKWGVLHVLGLGSEDETRLWEHLFEGQGYNPLIRPVHNISDTVKIHFGLAMIQLINIVRGYFTCLCVPSLTSLVKHN